MPGTKPKSMSRAEYVAFAAVRAYPSLQIRKVCCALRDRSLPLTSAVRVLFLQALFQVGDVTLPQGTHGVTSLKPLEWKQDLFSPAPVDGWEGFAVLEDE